MKRLLALCLVLAMTLAMLPVSAAASGDDLIKGSTKYSSVGLPEDEISYYYTDRYFDRDATAYNASLATMSHAFSMSTYPHIETAEYEDDAVNAITLLEYIGFTEITTNEGFVSKPTEDSVGGILAYKLIEDMAGNTYTVIAVSSKSGNYESEWASNFTIGESGRHQGFQDAAQQMMAFLKDYVNRNKASFAGEVKFWVTGYSRSAAAANLLSADLTKMAKKGEKLDDIVLAQKNIFAYCFECPKGGNVETLEDGENYVLDYLNIHNVVNDYDLVGKVAMDSWGFIRYGVDGIYNRETGEITKIIPTTVECDSREYDNMLALYQALDTNLTRLTVLNRKGVIYHALESFQGIEVNQKYLNALKKNKTLYQLMSKQFKKGYSQYLFIRKNDMTMSGFLDALCAALADGFISRSYYTEHFQPLFRVIASCIFGNGNEKQKWEEAMKLWTAELGKKSFSLIEAAEKGAKEIAVLLDTDFLNCLKKAGIDVKAYGGLEENLPLLMESLGRAMKSGGVDLLLTLIRNTPLLILGHIPELCGAWLESQDVNFEADLQDALAAERKPASFIKELFSTVKLFLGWN